MDLQESAGDMVVAGMDYDLVDWLISMAERSSFPALLDNRGLDRLQQSLLHIPGARVEVDPETSFWRVRHGNWLIATEPWGTECLVGQVRGEIPSSTGKQLPLYHAEAGRRRSCGIAVPRGADWYVAELWLPAAPLRPNPLGIDYKAVQVGVWRTNPEVWLEWVDPKTIKQWQGVYEDQLDSILKAIDEVAGQWPRSLPLLLVMENGELIDGHHRTTAGLIRGFPRIPALVFSDAVMSRLLEEKDWGVDEDYEAAQIILQRNGYQGNGTDTLESLGLSALSPS
jgi:hypothetical protein